MSFDSLITQLAQFAPTLGAFLLAYLVHSTVLFVLAWGLTSRRVGLPLHIKEYVWKGAVFGAVVTALLVTTTPAWRPSITLPGFLPKGTAVVIETAPPNALDFRAPRSISISSMPPAERLSRLAGQASPTPAATPSPAVFEFAVTPEPARPSIPVGAWFAGAFLTLAGLGLARLSFERARLSRTLGERLPIVSGPLARMFEELTADADLAGEVHLTQSHRLPTPVAIGTSEVCIPEGVLEALPREEQRCILAHELAHLIRRDPTWRMTLRAIESVFFFQPLNRVARARIQELAEFACDDYAAQNTQEGGIMMARSLASAAQWIESIQAPALAAALTRPESPLVQRVERLLGEPEARNLSQRQRALMVFASASFAILGAVAPTFAADKPPAPPAAPGAPVAPDTPAPDDVTNTRIMIRQNGKATFAPIPPRASMVTVGRGGKVSVVAAAGDDEDTMAYVIAGEPGEAPQVYTFQSASGGPPFPSNVRWVQGPGVGKRPAIGVNLMETGEVLASQLGIDAEKTVVLGDVIPDSAAEKAGLQKHDIVLSVNGQPADSATLRKVISETEVGQNVELEVLRAGRPQTFSVAVEEREDRGNFFNYAVVGTPAPGANVFAYNNEHLDKLRAELAESMSDPELSAEARRELEMELARAMESNTFFPPDIPEMDMAQFEASMARMHANQALSEAKLARLRALDGNVFTGSTAGSFSEVRVRFVDGVAADIANRLTQRDSSLNWDKINELARTAVQLTIEQGAKLSESINCKNGECKGTLSVDVNDVSAAITREMRNRAAEGGFEGNADIEKWLSDEVTDSVRANNNKKATWTN